MTSTSAPAADFSCAICLDTAAEPVVTRCGHLFCWECLDHWLHSAAGAPECPVCKGRVDERMAGDIIPLYGKGKQTSNRADRRPAPGSAAAAAAAPAEAADPAMEAFFSRPTAYSYAPGRPARRPSSTPTAAAAEEHHPRPAADRAPPRPRAAQPNVQMHVHSHGMPLTLGSSIFFFGGGGGMFLSLLLIVAWAVYNFAPWRDWKAELERRVNRMLGRPEPEAAPADREQRNAGGAAPAASAAAAGAADGAMGGGVSSSLPSQQVMTRNLVFSLLAVFVLFQLLLFV